MKLISYELQQHYPLTSQWLSIYWPRVEELGEPETLIEAREQLAEKQLRNPGATYRIIKCVRSIVE